MNPIIGEIRMWGGGYAPVGWALCDGSIKQISEFDALYTLLGTTYGGDGVQSFGLPDLRSRIPLHVGTGAGLQAIQLGQLSGTEHVTLTAANLPPHSHTLNAVSGAGALPDPTAAMLSTTDAAKTSYTTNVITPPATALPTPIAMSTASIVPTSGGSQPVSIVQPYATVCFIIATSGNYPSRP